MNDRSFFFLSDPTRARTQEEVLKVVYRWFLVFRPFWLRDWKRQSYSTNTKISVCHFH